MSEKIKIEWVSVDDIKPNPDNPRTISEERMEKLMESLSDFPKMLEYRPILVDRSTGHIIGGNQRHTAAKKLGWKKVAVIYLDGLQGDKLRELILKDNINFGEWDFDKLKEFFTQKDLITWGLEDARYVSFEEDEEDEYEESHGGGASEGGYEENQIKKIVFNLTGKDYDHALDKIVRYIEDNNLSDSSEALLKLIKSEREEPKLKRKKEKIRDYVIAIPSYKREDTLREKTLKMLHKNGIPQEKIYIFTANEEETKKYIATIGGKYNFVTGILTLCKQRRFIQEYFEEGQFIMHFDDDVSALEIKSEKGLEEYTMLEELMSKGVAIMKKNNTKIFSIYPVRNAFFMKENVSTDLKLMVGTAYGIINDKSPDLIIQLDEKEDYERTALYYKKFGKVIRLNNITLNTTFYKGKGGMVESRTIEKQQEAVSELLDRFPGYFAINNNRKSGYPEIRVKKQKK